MTSDRAEFSITVDIRAPARLVYEVMADVERWAEWTESIRSIKRLDAGPLALGSRTRVFQPRLLPATFKVIALEEGRSFTWVTRSLGVVATAEHRVEPVGAGSRVTLSVRYEGALGKLVGRMMRSLTEHYLELEAAGLKQRSEATGHGLEIRREDLTSPAGQALILALNDELSERYPEQGANHFRVDPEDVAPGHGAYLVASDRGVAVACGAIRRHDAQTAEIKRMYVVPEARGRGLSRLLLAALEAEGRSLGATRLVLETGDRQVEALALYGHSGFVQIPRFGEYLESPLSVCMAKDLR